LGLAPTKNGISFGLFAWGTGSYRWAPAKGGKCFVGASPVHEAGLLFIKNISIQLIFPLKSWCKNSAIDMTKA
jgi:hypothetical protein